MAYFGGDMGPAVKKWHWQKRRVISPFLRCKRSGRSLYLKEAYYGQLFLDWEFDYDIWLSKEEFIFAQLRGEFLNE